MAEHSMKLLTKEEIAEKLRCSTKTIERKVKKGLILPVDGTGGKYGRPLFNPMSIPALKRLANG